MNSLTCAESAYIAGIIDGEGCISMSKIKTRNSFSIKKRIMVANSNLLLIDWLHKTTGVGTVNEHCNGRNTQNGWKKQHIWYLTSKTGVELIHQIMPYLILKKQQAELFTEMFYLQNLSRRSSKFNEPRQEDILKEMHVLNQRGLN